MSARNLAPPGKRRGGPHQEAAHTVEVTTTDRPIVTDLEASDVDLARRWRRLGLGCPAGCGQYGHECGAGEPVVQHCGACGSLDMAARDSLSDCSAVCPMRQVAS